MVIEVLDEEMAVVPLRKTGAQRLQIVNSYSFVRELIEANVRAAQTGLDDDRIHEEVARRIACASK